MTVSDLVKASGIENQSDFSTFDYAIPINEDGSYPYDGNAISVYKKGRYFAEIVPYSELAKMALKNNPKKNQIKDLEEIAELTSV